MENEFDPFELAVVSIDGKRVFMDPQALEFNEQTVTRWLQESHGWYAYFSQVQHEAEKWLMRVEREYEREFDKFYLFYKSEGGTEKMAEARAKQETTVQALGDKVGDARIALSKIKSHVRSFDKAFSNATSLNYRQGKEIEKIMRTTGSRYEDNPDDDRINEIIKGSHEAERSTGDEG